ncbi:HNH endonuclease [Candidatus Pacearchaeota archaeon]|nr:HNH endonuclease [Candidatus Pacearchaeota archaeon]
MKGQQISYSAEELLFIKNNSKRPRKELHLKFSVKFERDDINQSNISALCKRKGWLTGRTGCFSKDQMPWNLGKKGYMGPNETTFKKGNRPANWKPLGTERLNKDGYIEIKIEEPKTWRLKHRYVWEQKNGSVKKGHIIILLDGNKKNCNIENLYEISRAVNSQLNKNGYGDLTGDLRVSAATMKELELQISKKLRTNK